MSILDIKSRNGTIINLNDSDDVIATLKRIVIKRRHYVDFTGDGWIEVSCQALESSSDLQKPAEDCLTHW